MNHREQVIPGSECCTLHWTMEEVEELRKEVAYYRHAEELIFSAYWYLGSLSISTACF